MSKDITSQHIMTLLGLIVCFIIITTQAAEWSYSGVHGPNHWKEKFQKCAEKQQSPINIYSGDVKVNPYIPPFLFSNYNKENGMTLSNNGHSAMITLGNDTQVLISGGGLSGSYQAIQFHFHWGNLSNTGSEHSIGGQYFPMELHIVHFNTKYKSITEAVAHNDGLAVLGFIYLISPADNVNYTNIVENLKHVQTKDAKINLKQSKLESLLPERCVNYYRYSGSLTTPPCDESVSWTLFTDPIYISENQLAGFRKLLDVHNQTMMNYRPIQPTNQRIVTANFDPHTHWQYGDAIQWNNYYETCGGENQSPINIESDNTLPESAIPLLAFQNYEKPALSGMRLKNNGHTVEVEIIGDEIAIYAGGLSETYIAKQFHFHWGEDATRGSEHQVDNQSFPMELHIVHYRKSLKNLATASSVDQGLAVLGFFFEISSSENVGLNQIINNLNNVDIPGKVVSIPAFSLNSILPLHKSDFYRYDGSLTTPGCSESVVWTVFKDTIKISEKQLAAFYRISSLDGDVKKPIINNFRPVQPLNMRVVRRNFNVPPPKVHWSYEGSHGTDHWPNVYKFCSNTATSRQSPIDIKYESMKYVTLDKLHMEGYELVTGVTIDLKNNGHAVQADISGGNMFLYGAGLAGKYRAAQFHFHWGADNKRGSEHLIDGRAFPMEVHFVHYNTDLPDLMKAATEKNGLAVLGILFELSEDDNKDYETIISALELIQKPYSRVYLDTIELDRLLPTNRNDYYRYEGSLTTPECHETVTWTIFKETLNISERQLKKFRTIFTVDETHVQVPLVNNYRPVQPINKRIVKATFQLSLNSGHKIQFVDVYFITILLCLLIFLI